MKLQHNFRVHILTENTILNLLAYTEDIFTVLLLSGLCAIFFPSIQIATLYIKLIEYTFETS